MNPINGEIRELLDSKIPGEIAALEEASSGLELVAAFCEANYGQVPHKQQAFNETKRLTLQSLASVAYYVNSLSKSLLRSLELENEKLAIKADEAAQLDQQVAIQKEKMARREIGKLTVNKSVNRSSKIVYPTVEEKAPKYQRTGIDYSLLDDVGHGRKVLVGYVGGNQQGFHLNRTGSMTSAESGGMAGMQSANIVEKIYASRVGNSSGLYSTLTRNSTRQPMAIDQQHQYRVPQAIPSTLQRPNQLSMNGGNNIYAHAITELPDSRCSTMTVNMASAYARGYNLVVADAASHQQQPPPHFYHGAMNYADTDGLPPPPAGQSHLHQHQHDAVHPDDPLPPPPNSMLPPTAPSQGAFLRESALNGDWVPRNYIEKARVIYGYEANRPDELTLSENDIVYVLRKNEDGWYEGVMNGVTGLFPGNYVQPVVS